MWQPGMSLEDVEKEVILKAFRFYQQNKTHTAHSLGIAIRTLDAKLEKYGEKKDVLQVGAKQYLESTPKPSAAQCTVPVQERKEVQEMSSPHSAQSPHKTKHSKRS